MTTIEKAYAQVVKQKSQTEEAAPHMKVVNGQRIYSGRNSSQQEIYARILAEKIALNGKTPSIQENRVGPEFTIDASGSRVYGKVSR